MTAQVPETLILDGKGMSMTFCPPIPFNDPNIFEKRNAEEMNKVHEHHIIYSTACWRNYIGIWEIKDGKLYLNDVLSAVKIKSGQPILANWFSGELRIPQGRLIRYVHGGFASVFRNELYIQVEKGMVTGQRKVRHSAILNFFRNMKNFLSYL